MSPTSCAADVEHRFLADESPRVASLDATKSFEGLDQAEKLYCYWLAKASWAGGRIIMKQWTHSAADLYDFIMALFQDPADRRQLRDLEPLKKSVSPEDWQALLSYCAQCLSNLVNYRTFGDIKFIPRLSLASFQAVVQATGSQRAQDLWAQVSESIYSSTPAEALQIGKPADGHVSAYYTWDASTSPPSDAQVKAVQALCDATGVVTTNTKLHKASEQDFVVQIASVNKAGPFSEATYNSDDGRLRLSFAYGLYSEELSRVNEALEQAQLHCGSDRRRAMLHHYIQSFASGSIDEHKKGSQIWVQDAGPTVESYIGFIEAYVDPWCYRAEWEGFVSIVNKELSKKFNVLVEQAEQLITCLPWGADFEVDHFQKPDYTALEIVNFATGGIPAGINLPNYDEIRESHGFKNVSLINILGSSPNKEDIKFLEPKDLDMFLAWQQRVFEVQVANHELLGHGSGKLLVQREDGTFNFDRNLVNPLTGKPVESWYKPGERPGSKLGEINGSLEECRAEAVAVFLCSNLDILKVFGYTQEDDIRVLRIMTFLSMSWAGLRALEYYDPKTKKHGQAHMRARFGIFKWLVQADIAQLNITRNEDGSVANATVSVDEEAVLDGRGQKRMGDLLVRLQVLKATADGLGAKSFYESLTAVDKDEWAGPIRDFVLANKTARKLWVQPTLELEEDGQRVKCVCHATTYEGLVESMLAEEL